jgi:glyoxylase-like metal-dependent hydrolase (beta-lactamase superfamily II)
MREIVEGVIAIPIDYVNAYAVVVDDGVVLVDTGLPGRADKVASAITDTRRRIGELHLTSTRDPRGASAASGAINGRAVPRRRGRGPA